MIIVAAFVLLAFLFVPSLLVNFLSGLFFFGVMSFGLYERDYSIIKHRDFTIKDLLKILISVWKQVYLVVFFFGFPIGYIVPGFTQKVVLTLMALTIAPIVIGLIYVVYKIYKKEPISF